MEDIITMPASETMTPEQALDSAKQAALSEVFIIGTDADKNFFVRSSRMSCRDALWLAEQLKQYALSSGGTE